MAGRADSSVSGPIQGDARSLGAAIPALDGLRAVSILLVMVSHSGLQHLVPGVLGVTIFFFISGFLITTLLMQEHARTGTIAIGPFYTRRLLRLYPPLIAFVGISGVAWIVAGGRLDPLGVFAALAYLTNYFAIFAPERLQGLGGQLWSLAVEEHFYLVFPWLLLAFQRWRRWLVGLLVALCLAALGLRIHVTLNNPDIATAYTGMASECRVDAILFGALAALFRDTPIGRRWIGVVTHPLSVGLGLGTIVLTLVYRDPFFRETVRHTLQGLALAAPVLALTSTDRFSTVREILDSRPFAVIGILSYSLYLWHLAGLSLGEHLAAVYALPVAAAVAVGWSATFLFAALSYRLVERPFFALRRRFGSHVRSVSPEVGPTMLGLPPAIRQS